MKKISGWLLFFVLVIAACGPTSTATETGSPPQDEAASTEPAVTEPPATEAPTQAPALQVGLVFPYFDGVTLVSVPGGEFTMGGTEGDNLEHQVTLRDYWIYSTKVTNQQYAWCVSQGKCTPPDLTDNPGYSDIRMANDPVTGVTYDQAATYCSFVGGRLPTEAEWEKAARNPDGGEYPWGAEPPSCNLANFNNCMNGTSSVVKYANGASYYGALDMLGNVFEWVSDWYDANYYQGSPSEDPSGPETGSSRVVRSSGYDSSLEDFSITKRFFENPQNHRPNLGFRCVVEEPTGFSPYCESPLVYGADGVTTACPTLELAQVELCAKNFPYTNVTVNGADDAKLNAQGCAPTDKPDTVSCQPPTDLVSAQAGCQVNVSGSPACPAGYSLQGNSCIADGSQGTCPAGSTFDPAKQCCSLPSTASVCPVGTFYVASKNACLPEPVQELVTVSAAVEYKSCIASGGPGGCQEPKGGCPAETDWNKDLCCCTEQLGGPLVCSNRK